MSSRCRTLPGPLECSLMFFPGHYLTPVTTVQTSVMQIKSLVLGLHINGITEKWFLWLNATSVRFIHVLVSLFCSLFYCREVFYYMEDIAIYVAILLSIDI